MSPTQAVALFDRLGVRLRPGVTAADVLASEGGVEWFLQLHPDKILEEVLATLVLGAPDGSRFTDDAVAYDYEISAMWDLYATYLHELVWLARVEVRNVEVEVKGIEISQGRITQAGTARISFSAGPAHYVWTLKQSTLNAADGFLGHVARLLRNHDPSRSLTYAGWGCLVWFSAGQAAEFEAATGLPCRAVTPLPGIP